MHGIIPLLDLDVTFLQQLICGGWREVSEPVTRYPISRSRRAAWAMAMPPIPMK